VIFSLLPGIGVTGSTAEVASTRRTTMTAGARRAASALVAAEMAIATVLLVGAGLTLRSFSNLMSADPGFRPDHVVSLQMALPPGRYSDAHARRDLFDRAFAAIAALPGVQDVGAGAVTPLTGNNWTIPLQRPEQPLAPGERAPDVGWQLASRGYFGALRIPLRAGRLFDDRDAPGTRPVVIVSEGLAARYFAGENPVGRRVVLGDAEGEIVGVVGDIRRAALSDQPRADMYLPFERDPGQSIGLFIRTDGDPLGSMASIRTALRAVEPNLVVYSARSMDDVAAESAAVARLAMRLLGGFAAIALALAAIGVYGVMSYSVRRRSREMGTRIALGAGRGDIITLVIRQALTVTAIGLAAGLLSGLAAARSLGSMLYGVPPWDPLSVGGAALVLLLTGLIAGYLPARRAARTDPARTLAAE
jgi:putative ABC transport system permease protein